MAALPGQQQAVAAHPRSTTRSRLLPAIQARQASKLRVKAAARSHARPLLLDNYDSYTYNLYQIIADAYGGRAQHATAGLHQQ